MCNEIPDMRSLKDAVEGLEYKVSYDYLRNLCLADKVPCIRTGSGRGKFLVNFGKLCEYLNKTEAERRSTQERSVYIYDKKTG